MIQSVNLCFYWWELQGRHAPFRRNFGEISQIPRIRENFPRKFSRKFLGKFPENSGCFPMQVQCYRAKITFFIIIKVMEIQKSFRKISGKISEMSKIPGRNFPGKFPGNSGCFSGEMQ
jgi:hypothetical protein